MFDSWRKAAKRRLGVALFAAKLLASTAASAATPGITAPTPIGSIAVAYPGHAHGDAVVDLVLVLAEDGTVAQAEVQQGDAPFAEAARHAAENFRFQPATRNGIPVRARVALRVVFQEPVAPPAAAPSPGAPSHAAAQEAPSEAASVPKPAAPTQVVVLGEQRPTGCSTSANPRSRCPASASSWATDPQAGPAQP